MELIASSRAFSGSFVTVPSLVASVVKVPLALTYTSAPTFGAYLPVPVPESTVTLPLLASIEYFVVYEPIVVISPSASVYVAVALETSVLSAYFALAVPSPAANTA